MNNIVLKEGNAIITQIEVELIKHFAEGLSAKEIANEQRKAVRTIEVQMQNLRKKTGCKNAAHLVATFLRQKLID